MHTHRKSDHEKIIELLDRVETLLLMLVEDDGDFVLREFATDSEYRSLLRNAWQQARNRLREAKEKLESLAPLTLWETDEPSYQPENELEKRLGEVGLLGDELNFKYDLINKLLNRFMSRRTSLWLRRLLGSFNSFLGSLSKAIPGIDAVEEIKKMIEQTLKVDRRKSKSQG